MKPTLNTTLNTTWDDTAVAILRQLRLEGHSFARIAAIMAKHGYKFSRNACLAKADRLSLRAAGPGEPSRPEIVRHRKPIQPTYPAPEAGEITAQAGEGLSATALRGAGTHPPARQGPLRLEDLGQHQCRFAVTPHRDTEHRFCGQPVQPGSRYCATHHAKCHTSRPEVRDPTQRDSAQRDAGLANRLHAERVHSVRPASWHGFDFRVRGT